MARTLFEGLNGWCQKSILNRVRRLTARLTGKPDEDEAKAMAGEAAAPPGCIDVMSTCLAEIAQKYQVLGQWTPEAMFCAAAGTWAMGFVNVNRRLDHLEAAWRNHRPQPSPATAAPSGPNPP